MKRIIFLYGALVLGALAWTAWWFVLANRAEHVINTEITALQARGVAVSYTARRVHGYPYRLSAGFENPDLRWRSGGREWRWRSAAADIHTEPWNLRHAIAVLQGAHSLSLAGAPSPLTLDIDTEAARASLVLDKAGKPQRLIAEITGLQLHSSRAGDRDAGAARFQFAARQAPPPDSGLDMAVQIDDLLLPLTPPPAFERRISFLSADTTLAGGPPPAAWTSADLARWRDRGGVLDVRTVEIHWGPMTLRGAGRVTLDGSLRLQGEIQARIAGFQGLIDILLAQRLINEGAAQLLGLVLGLAAEPSEDGGPPEVRAPVTLNGGVLSLGPVPILTLPPLA